MSMVSLVKCFFLIFLKGMKQNITEQGVDTNLVKICYPLY